MKLGWLDGRTFAASLDGRTWRDATGLLSKVTQPSIWDGPTDWTIGHLPEIRDRIGDSFHSLPELDVGANACWLAPVVRPGKVIGIPVNYQDHIDEVAVNLETFTTRYTGEIRKQGYFLKATSSVVGAGEGVVVRFPDRETHHELELAAIIGRKGTNIGVDEALSYIAGYCIGLDMVVRGPEDRSMRKSLDTYSVLGPYLTTVDELPDVSDLHMTLSVNGEQRQSSYPRDMIVNIAEQIAWISECCTLWPGDVIMTGTSKGVSRVVPGDVMTCAIDGVGSMTVNVR
ncbi:fumarylacetoacetate hydrolase family protein [Paraburkholderia phymatum]|uniref:fumarylacetoacetate hydrolase family protein n=1 Tax=Paraburkholderia phymatum TaxID=148447 RepID=UPI00316D3426